MASWMLLTALITLVIFICAPAGVSSDCTSCCNYNTGCATAYNGGPAKCCGSGILRFCCPTRSTCGSYPYCTDYRYWGDLTLGQLIGVVLGSIFGFYFLLAVCGVLCRRRRQQAMIARPMYAPQSFANPVGHQVPPPYQISSNA